MDEIMDAEFEAIVNGIDRVFPHTVGQVGDQVNYPGLTKREYFAGQIMGGLVSTSTLVIGNGSEERQCDRVSKIAVLYADALLLALAAREAGKNE